MRWVACFLGPIAIAWASCQEFPEAIPCGQIPDDGCPIGRGGSCDDVFCAALYDCVEGAWTVVTTCGATDAGADGSDGGAVDAGDAGDAGPDACSPTGIDHTDESVGCTPDLQDPDCPANAAEPCAETACATGCLDFYLCTADGWRGVAHCTDEGAFALDSP